jgi:hypothetical protein
MIAMTNDKIAEIAPVITAYGIGDTALIVFSFI